MQPTNNPRPVMDVTAPPKPPAAGGAAMPTADNHPPQALPVHEEPVQSENVGSSPDSAPPAEAADKSDTNAPADNAPPEIGPPVNEAEENSQPPMPASDKPHAPVGAIVGAVFGMLLLSGAAVIIYMNS